MPASLQIYPDKASNLFTGFHKTTQAKRYANFHLTTEGWGGEVLGRILEHLHPHLLSSLLPSVLFTLCLLRTPSSPYPTPIPPLLGRKLLSPSRLPGPRVVGWGLSTCRTHLPRCQLDLSANSHFSLVVLLIPQNNKAGGLNQGVIYSTIALYLVLWGKWLPLE